MTSSGTIESLRKSAQSITFDTKKVYTYVEDVEAPVYSTTYVIPNSPFFETDYEAVQLLLNDPLCVSFPHPDCLKGKKSTRFTKFPYFECECFYIPSKGRWTIILCMNNSRVGASYWMKKHI